jgi:hypothetical protein
VYNYTVTIKYIGKKIMSYYIDRKYTTIFGSTYLEQFKVVKENPFVAKCRCPACGDSQKNKFKTRGYFYQVADFIAYRCHNCGHTGNIGSMMRLIAPNLADEYRLEAYRDEADKPTDLNEGKFVPDITKFAKRRIDKFEHFKSLKKISQLEPDHPAKQYIINRRIPERQHWRLYYAPKFYTWANSVVPDKFSEKNVENDEDRIVIPFINEQGYVFGFTGRSLKKDSNFRYATVMIDDTENKLFGADQIDREKDIYVLEGPLDSLFIDNAVAMAGTDCRLDLIAPVERMTIVIDNQPRNPEVVAKVEKLVNKGYKVCIWPEYVKAKDINDLVLEGNYPERVKTIIDENTFQGLEAQIQLSNWKKI